KLRGGVFEVLATSGDTRLGGDDLDARLADVALADLPADLRARPAVRAAALAAAERSKRALSAAEEAELTLTLPDGQAVRRTVTRSEFEALVQDVVARTAGPSRQALRDAGLSPREVGEVVAVGGSTRVPLVRRTMEEIFG